MSIQCPNSARGLLGLALCIAICAVPSLAVAGTDEAIFGGGSPLERFRDFILGPFAYTLVIGGLAMTGANLVFGGQMDSLGRRSVMVVIAGGILIFADSVLNNIFTGRGGASLAGHEEIVPWTEPGTTEASAVMLVAPGARE